MSDCKQVNIMEGHAQVGTGNTQVINPTTINNPTTNNKTTNNNTTTNNNPTTNNTTNNNTSNSGVNIHFQQNNNYNIYLSNAPEPVAQHNTTSQLLSREQLLQLQQVGLITEEAVQQVTEQPSPSCDECRIRARPQCLTCVTRTIPGQSVPPPSQSVGESPQTCPPESPQSRCPLSDHHQPSRKSGRDTDSKQKSSRKNKETDRQPPNQIPGCSESDQTSRVPAEETVPTIQPASTETAECVRLVDCEGRELQPGDAVCVHRDGGLSEYYGIYVGGLELIRCDQKTQEVKMEMMDVSDNFYSFTVSSESRCKFFPAETRLDRARSRVGEVSPVRETELGRDFVLWTFTGLNYDQAMDEEFDLWFVL